jgi:hypothetical protein
VIRILLAAALLSGTALAASDPPPPGGIPDIAGARTIGLSAGIGAAGGNDGMYLNPATIAARKRYSVEGLGVLDRRGAETVDRFLGGSVVDSQSSDVAAGFSYLRAGKGVYEGNLLHLALGGPIARGFWVGAGAKYDSVTASAAAPATLKHSTTAVTADAGILWQISELVSIGGAGYNLVPIGNKPVAPMGAGAGIALGSDTSFQITADWRADFDRAEKTKNRYSVGAEALLLHLIPVRAGFMHDEVLSTNWWSAGIGIVTTQGVALDVGYRQSTTDTNARTIAASLRFFLFQ